MAVLLTMALANLLVVSQVQQSSGLMFAGVLALENNTPNNSHHRLDNGDLSLTSCADMCFNHLKCNSFFHGNDKANFSCMIFSTVYWPNTPLLKQEDGYKYYQLYDETSTCNCFAKLREVDMPLIFIPIKNLSSGARVNRTRAQASKACESIGGRLPILDTKLKCELFKEMLTANIHPDGNDNGPYVGLMLKSKKHYQWDNKASHVVQSCTWLNGVPSASHQGSGYACVGMGYTMWPNQSFTFGLIVRHCENVPTPYLICEKDKNSTCH